MAQAIFSRFVHEAEVRADSDGDYDFTLPNSSAALLTVEPGRQGAKL